MKKPLSIFLLLLVTLIFGLSSCLSIMTKCYGVKKIKPVKEQTILRFANKYNIPKNDLYELDTSYFNYLFSLDTSRFKSQIKNHYQPLQVQYFGNEGFVKTYLVNCYAGGFPNLKWNRNEILTTFPPKQQAPIDSLISLNTQMKFLKPLSQSSTLSIDNFDYVVLVFWNRFMGRQSKRLIHFVQANCKLDLEKKVKIIYVNTDNIFSKM
jgi:hypothetical protein